MPKDNFYDDGDDSMPQGEPKSKADKTALIPKSLCPDMEVGSTGKFKIVAAHDNDFEIEYVHEKSDESDMDEEETPAPASVPSGEAGMYD